jgi:hypothetical protein
MLKRLCIILSCLAVATQSMARAVVDGPMPALRPDQVAFLALFKELQASWSLLNRSPVGVHRVAAAVAKSHLCDECGYLRMSTLIRAPGAICSAPFPTGARVANDEYQC